MASVRGISHQGHQAGFTLLEIMVVLAIMAIFTSQGADWYMQYTDRQVAKVVSTQHKQVDQATAAYLKKNYTALMAGALPATKTIDVLKTDGFLPDYMFDCSSTPCKLRNNYGQEYRIVVRKAGTAPNQRLEALLMTFGGETLDKGDMIQVARNLGASGGYVEGVDAIGAMEGWKIPAVASLFGAGANVGTGHLVSALYFVDGTQSTDYLYRNSVPGKPELNEMGTDLDMGGNSVKGADQILAKRGQFSRDGSGPCCGDTGTISLSELTSTTGKTASINFHNGGVSEGGIELAGSGSRRIRVFDNQGITMGLEATGGIQSNAGWLASYGNGLLSNVWQSHSGGRWVDTGSRFESNRSLYTAGNFQAAGQVSSNTVVTNGLTVNGNAAVSGDASSNRLYSNYIQSNGSMYSASRLTTNEFLQINGVATEGGGCSPNGVVGRNAAGALLSCQSGVWKSPGGLGRTLYYRGSSSSVSIPNTVNFASMTFDLGGRGDMQYLFDLAEANAYGLRIYNRGGENADRPYDAVFSVSNNGSSWVITGVNSWGGTPVIKSVTGFY